jgi:hypothetical protein
VDLITGTQPNMPASPCLESYFCHKLILTMRFRFVNDIHQAENVLIVLGDLCHNQI